MHLATFQQVACHLSKISLTSQAHGWPVHDYFVRRFHLHQRLPRVARLSSRLPLALFSLSQWLAGPMIARRWESAAVAADTAL